MTFKGYIEELERNLKSGLATEPSYYPALKALLESIDPGITAVVNPKKTAHGGVLPRTPIVVLKREVIDATDFEQ